MKIGIYTVSLFRQVTGIEKVGIQVAEALIEDGHTVTWIAPSGPVAPIATLPQGVSVELLPYGISPDHVAALRSIVERRKFDLIIAMVTNGVASLFPVALEGLETALIFSEHNQPEFYVDKWWGLGLNLDEKMNIRDALIKTSDKVHVLRESCIPKGVIGRDRICVIPNATMKSCLRAQSPSHDQRNRFISIGRLSPEKGLLDGLAAFAEVSSKLPDWDYTIFGEGPLLEQLRAHADQMGISNRVQFLGHTHHPLQELSASQILLMPSKFEGWPLVAGEAQSVGLPILGYRDCDALAQCFDYPGGGHLVNTRTTQDMAQAMHEIATNTVRWQKLSQNALASVLNREPGVIGKQWVQLVKEALAEKGQRHSRLQVPQKTCDVNQETNSTFLDRGALDYLRKKIQQHSNSQPEQPGRHNLHGHAQAVFKFVSRGKVKSAARAIRNDVWPIVQGTLKEPFRLSARHLDGPKITLYTLPSIEDGPRHLAKHLKSAPHVIYDIPGHRLGAKNYLKLLTSKVIVTEGGIPKCYQANQQLIQIWHSTGFIKKGANLKSQLRESDFKNQSGDFMHVIAPSSSMIPMYAKAFCVPPSRVLPFGSIKTDYLLDPAEKSAFANQLTKKVPSLTDKRVYVFAPTFRGQWPDCLFHYSSLNLDEVNEALSDNERLIVNLHPSLAASPLTERGLRTNLVPQPQHDKIIDAHAESLTIQMLLASADIFISDYSGGLLDAIAAQIPTLCFADDLDHYYHQLTPGFVDEVPNLITTPGSQAFVDALKTAHHDSDKLHKFRERWVGACDGRAGARVAKLVEGL